MPDNSDDRPVLRRIRDLSVAIQAEFDAALTPLELTAAQYGVLRRVQENPGQSSAELARLVHVTAQSMHELVVVLERRGLLHRTGDRGRTLRITLTPDGRKLLRRGRARADRLSERLVDGLGAEDHRRLLALLGRLEDNVGRPGVR